MKLSYILVVGLSISFVAGMLFHTVSHHAAQHRGCSADHVADPALEHAIDHLVEHALQEARMRDHRSVCRQNATARCAPSKRPRAGSQSGPRHQRGQDRAITQDTILVDIQRATVEELLSSDRRMSQARLLPRRGERGGARVAAIRSGGVFDLIGLRDGDVILTINEEPVAVPVSGLDALGGFHLPEYIDFAIERDGQRIRIVVLLHD